VTVNIALFDDLEAVAADAAGALDRSALCHPQAPNTVFRSLDWYRLIERHCPPPGRLLVVRARCGHCPTAAWLFLARRGAKAVSYSSYYSLRAGFTHYQPDQAETPDCATAIARALRRAALARIEMGPDDHGRWLGHAPDFRRAGWAVILHPDKAAWVAHTGGLDFDAYWSSRPARLRNTFKRKAKAAALDIAIHDRFDAGAWADYEAVYRSSWKPEEGSFPFLRALAEQEGAAGTLRLGVAKKDGRPVAAQLWLVESGVATIHKLAYAEEAKAMSPGTILSEAMFRRAIDGDRARMIDYGLGDEGYKRDWMDERRQVWRLEAFNLRHPIGLIGAARAKASALVRRLTSR
jgi:CelD/BcsL family acetyltransferase involved in cellulose biosynthesis